MSYYCPNCGERENFKAVQSYTERGTRRVYIDGEGDVDDWGDTFDSETDDTDLDEIECNECSTSVDWYDTDEELEEAELRRLNEEERAGLTSVLNWQTRIRGEQNGTRP